MSYRDDDAALAQRASDLSARLSALRKSRQQLEERLAEERALRAELRAVRKRLAPTPAELRRKLPLLQSVSIAAPCSEDWDGMTGDARVRHCGACDAKVYNLSALTAPEAEALLKADGKVCVRVYLREDGTVLTQDCAVGLRRRKRQRLAYVALAAVTLGTSLASAFALWRAQHPLPVQNAPPVVPLAPRLPVFNAADPLPATPAVGPASAAPAVDPAPSAPPATQEQPRYRPRMGRPSYHPR